MKEECNPRDLAEHGLGALETAEREWLKAFNKMLVVFLVFGN